MQRYMCSAVASPQNYLIRHVLDFTAIKEQQLSQIRPSHFMNKFHDEHTGKEQRLYSIFFPPECLPGKHPLRLVAMPCDNSFETEEKHDRVCVSFVINQVIFIVSN